MKALTVHQPWAAAIIHAGKNVENRSWYHGFTGWLAIHAGKQVDYDAVPFMRARGLILPALHEPLLYGHIIGVVKVTGAHHASSCLQLGLLGPAKGCSPWAMHGQMHWQLEDPRPCKPVALCGFQGLWDVPGDVVIDLAFQTNDQRADGRG